MAKTAIITGSGSGVGRAVALRMAAEGWTVALVGRTAKGLEETRQLAGTNASNLHVFSCDIADPVAAEKTVAAAVNKLGGVTALVNCAGTNIPRRSLEVLNAGDYQSVIAANLNGTVYFVLGVLPAMRKAGSGTIVNIVSDAGMFANAKAGAAYVASKFGVSGLTQSINAEERQHGIRACAIYPGDIATPLLDKRPVPPPMEARAKMIQPEDMADCVMLCVNLPDRAVVEQMLVRPR
ncbi:SDR family oxidoreductase [Humisphaera borealis]|uniref:SDR family oxidoreductase n=1 Tax=Humisphaera borealis TaxID=2807512 RepID=A0A7M2X020_9BACT|nr:SDR family oxidoreductase [Humisphaera borealis]QOV90792.1 SDR family oxidoreductase [Humisphaera borealis]